MEKKRQAKLCLNPTCDSRASFGYEKKEYCQKHKKHDMTNFHTYKCLECNTQASFGYPIPHEKLDMKLSSNGNQYYGGKKEYCQKHKKNGMVSFTNRRCLECDKQASFGYENDRKRVYCAKHSKLDMVYLKKRKLNSFST